MKIERGDIYTANLSPIQGSEQGGIRPVIIFQKNTISQFTTKIIDQIENIVLFTLGYI